MTDDRPRPNVPMPRHLALKVLGFGVVAILLIVVASWWWQGRSQPVPWREVSFEDSEVVVDYAGRACEETASLSVKETEEEVVLTVHASGRGLGCDDEGKIRQVTGTLDDGLGSRVVIDGACRRADLAHERVCEGK